MTRSRFASLAIASAIVLPAAIHAARPHYGGPLRIEMVGVIRTFDPAATPGDGAEATARTRVLPLVFESLVAADPSGGVRPLLAASWERDAAGQRWRSTAQRRDASRRLASAAGAGRRGLRS